MWSIEISQFSARNLKHHLSSELGALEVEFGPLAMGKPDWVGFGWMQNWILPNSKFFARFRVRFAKLWPFYRTTSKLGFRRCGTNSDEKSGEAMTMQTSRRICGMVVARKERLKTSFTTYLRPAARIINIRRLAGQTDECSRSVCYWIGGIG
jgi:hypothetical protein